ncbi:MAG: type II toxin-antitoxin system RatA family toxin [Gammaproteobacteria bacterium]|nr:type II toxin-antitoxin system RatA family toxin [Gammaproteobacteria bacterium]
MKKVNRQAIVPYSCQQMFELVNDIEQYPEFLPYCGGSEIIERQAERVIATLTVSKGSFEQRFTTKNINKPFSAIEMSLVDGPFKYLNGLWSFTELSEQASKIELTIEYEFSNKLLGLAFGNIFSQLAESFVDAFTQRARELYKVNHFE